MSVQKALIQYANQVKQGAENLLEHTHDWQIIKKYLSNRFAQIELSAGQKIKLERFNFIYNQLASGKYTESEVVNQLMTLEKYKLSQSQALADVHATKELWVVALDINKQFEIKLQLDLNKIQLQKADMRGDARGYAALEKNRQKLLAMLPDKDDTPADTFEPHTIIVEFDPALIGAPPIDNLKEFLQEMNSKHKVKIDTSFFEEAEVIPDGNE
jgi:hypothetical protein